MAGTTQPESSLNVNVAIRVRPCISREEGQDNFWQVEGSQKITEVDPTTKKALKGYYFDRVFSDNETTGAVYKEIALPIVDAAMDGYNGTIFAYGQTSSGKTYTMQGTDSNPGVILRGISDIFGSIEKTPDREFLLRISYAELYNEELRDLLSSEKKTLTIREDGKRVFVQNLSEEMVTSYKDVIDLLKKGEARRHIAGTNMNEHSSRSHTIFCIIIESREIANSDNSDLAVKVAHLNLVDLAGSERANETGAEGTRLQEACKINQSLFCLGQVINKLSSQSSTSHIPYRASKLTRMLQTSLGGNAKTAIICTVTPAAVTQTHSTLQFASSAKTIQNKPKVNEVLSDEAMLRKCRKEIQELKNRISMLEGQPMSGHAVLQEQLERERTEKEKLKELLQVEQEDKVNQLKKLIIVSSVSKQTEQKSKFNRRQTWCPGSRKSFFPPAVAMSKNVGLSSIIETSMLNDSVDSLSSDTSSSILAEKMPSDADFFDASFNTVFEADFETKRHSLETTLPADSDMDLMPPPMSSVIPPPSSTKKRRGRQVHFAETGAKLVQPEGEEVGCQTDFKNQELEETVELCETLIVDKSALQDRLDQLQADFQKLQNHRDRLAEELATIDLEQQELKEFHREELNMLQEELAEVTQREPSDRADLDIINELQAELNLCKNQYQQDLENRDESMERLRKNLADAEAANADANRRLCDLEEECEQVTSEKQDREHQIVELQTEVAYYKGLADQVPGEEISRLDSLKKSLADSEMVLMDTNKKLSQLRTENEALKVEIANNQTDKLEKSVESLRRSLTDAEMFAMDTNKRLSQKITENEVLKAKLESSGTRVEDDDELIQELAHFKQLATETATKHEDVLATVESLNTSLSEAKATISDTEEELLSLRTQNMALQEEITKLICQTDDVTRLEDEVELYKRQAEEASEKHANLVETIDTLEKNLSDAEMVAVDSEKKLSELETENETLKCDMAKLGSRTDETTGLAEEIEEYRRREDEASEKHSSLVETIDLLEKNLSDAETVVMDSERKMSELEAENATLKSDMAKLSGQTDDVTRLEQEVERYRAQADEMSEKHASLVETIDTLEKNLSDAEMVAVDSERKMSELESENEALKSDIAHLDCQKDEVTRLEQEVDHYKRQAEEICSGSALATPTLTEESMNDFDTQAKLNGQTDEVTRLAEEVEAYKRQADEAAGKHASLLETIDTLEKNYSDAEMVAMDSEQKISDLESENETLKSDIAKLSCKTDEITRLEEEVELYKRQAEEAKLTNQTDEVTRLEEEVEHYKRQSCEATEQHATLLETIESLEKNLSDAEMVSADSNRLLELESENDTLKSEIAKLNSQSNEVTRLEQEVEHYKRQSCEATEQHASLLETIESLEQNLSDAEMVSTDSNKKLLELESEKETLKSEIVKIASQASDLTRLEEEVEHYRKLSCEATEKQASLLETIDALEKNAETAATNSDKILQLETENKILKSEIVKFNQQTDEVTRIEGELEHYKRQSSELSDQHDQLLHKIQTVEKSHSDAELVIRETDVKLSELNSENGSLKLTISDLEGRVAEMRHLQEELEHHKTKFDEVSEKYENLNRTVEMLTQNLRDSEMIASDANAKLFDLEKENQYLKEKTVSFEDKVSEAESLQRELEQQKTIYVEISAKHGNLLDEMQKQTERAGHAEMVCAEAKSRVSELEVHSTQMESCIGKLRDETSKQQGEIGELKGKLSTEQETREYYESEYRRFCGVMSDMDDELEELIEENRGLEEKLSETQKNGLKVQLHEQAKLEAQIEELQGKVTEEQKTLAKEKEMRDYFESEYKRFCKVCSDMDDELEDEIAKNRGLEEKLSEAQAKFKAVETRVRNMEEELRRKGGHENHGEVLKLERMVEERELEIYKLKKQQATAKEVEYLQKQLNYYKKLSEQYQSELKEQRNASQEAESKSSEAAAPKMDYFGSGTNIVDKIVVTSVLKAQNGQLEREVAKMKSENEHLGRKVEKAVSFFEKESLKRKFFESEAAKWKSKAKSFYQKLKEKNPAVQDDHHFLEKGDTPLQDVRAEELRLNSPAQPTPTVEKIPIRKKKDDVEESGKADENSGKTDSKSGWLEGFKFTERSTTARDTETLAVDRPECKTQ